MHAGHKAENSLVGSWASGTVRLNYQPSVVTVDGCSTALLQQLSHTDHCTVLHYLCSGHVVMQQHLSSSCQSLAQRMLLCLKAVELLQL
jgi:hypothetical protein